MITSSKIFPYKVSAFEVELTPLKASGNGESEFQNYESVDTHEASDPFFSAPAEVVEFDKCEYKDILGHFGDTPMDVAVSGSSHNQLSSDYEKLSDLSVAQEADEIHEFFYSSIKVASEKGAHLSNIRRDRLAQQKVYPT
jgi:hypothetical protein